MACCAGAGGRCARISSILLAHVNLLLVLFSGAALAAAARLKWDPSAYVPLRELLPREYPLVCGVLLAGAAATLLLAHLALAALFLRRSPTIRCAALCLYCVLTLGQVCAEVGGGVWAYRRAREWVESRDAQQLAELMQARDHILAALQLLSRWFPLPEKLNALIQEAEADLPRNAYAAGGAAAALVALQVGGALLALCAARRRRPPPCPSASTLSSADGYLALGCDHSRSRLTFHSAARRGGRPHRGDTHGRLVTV